MKSPPILALLFLMVGCATAPPLAPGITGLYHLESMDGAPLPSKMNVVAGTLQLRENRTFTWRFSTETLEGTGSRQPAPIVFEGRFVVEEDASGGLLIQLTRRDGVSGSQERIKGRLVGSTLSFASPDLTAVFQRR